MRFYEKLHLLLKEKSRPKKDKSEACPGAFRPRGFSGSLEANVSAVRAEFGECCDLIVRRFTFGKVAEIRAALVFIDGLADLGMINDNIIKPLMFDSRFFRTPEGPSLSGADALMDTLLTAGDVQKVAEIPEVADACLSGDAVLIVEGLCEAVRVSVRGWEKRAITEPNTETVIRGPREGFTESLRTNTAMVRRKIRSPALRIRSLYVGRQTRTQVNILYMEGIADPNLIKEIERRLKKIDTDAVLAAGYLEQYIEDSPFSIFQTIWYSEKPDAIAGKLLEGRAAILVDGTPFVLSVPMLFVENFQTSEDYAIRSYYATMLRLLRMSAFMLSLFAPAIYVSLTTFHQELIPTDLLITMMAATEGVPFPAAVEMGIMIFTFEIIREAGIRMPRPVGQAISIVGALVMGQSAVEAGIVGAPVLITIAITAISSFAIPLAADAIAILRWAFLILAATLGSFGITLGAVFLLVDLTSLKSFGIDYMAPLAPFQPQDLKDTAVRVPMWMMRTRPRALKPRNMTRQSMANPASQASDSDSGMGGKL